MSISGTRARIPSLRVVDTCRYSLESLKFSSIRTALPPPTLLAIKLDCRLAAGVSVSDALGRSVFVNLFDPMPSCYLSAFRSTDLFCCFWSPTSFSVLVRVSGGTIGEENDTLLGCSNGYVLNLFQRQFLDEPGLHRQHQKAVLVGTALEWIFLQFV